MGLEASAPLFSEGQGATCETAGDLDSAGVRESRNHPGPLWVLRSSVSTAEPLHAAHGSVYVGACRAASSFQSLTSLTAVFFPFWKEMIQIWSQLNRIASFENAEVDHFSCFGMKPSETLLNAKACPPPVYYNTVNIMIVSITEVSFKFTPVQSNHHLLSCIKAHSTVGT